MSFARINGVLLHYRLSGPADAPLLVLVNSLGTDLRIWDEMAALLDRRYRLLAYDKRGHGLSDTPPGEYRLDDHVSDLCGLIDRLGVRQLAVCGVSIGGMIAQGLALARPQQVDALVLCDTAARFGDPESWTSRIAAIRSGGMAAIADQVMQRWFSPAFFERRADELAGWRNLFLRTDPAGYMACCATLRDADLSARLDAIACPVQVVAGEHDRSTPVEMVRAFSEAIPHARFAVIPGAGHIPSIEQPAMLAQIVTQFLEEAGHG